MMNRIEREKITIEHMISLYCRKKEGRPELCPACRELLDYAYRRLDRCRFGNQKTACKKCPAHCYRPPMREKIRAVMRFSGPRLIWYHPIEAIRYILNK